MTFKDFARQIRYLWIEGTGVAHFRMIVMGSLLLILALTLTLTVGLLVFDSVRLAWADWTESLGGGQ